MVIASSSADARPGAPAASPLRGRGSGRGEPFGSSMARVTASAFAPYQGGTTAPNPPAGPPAATTSRSSGERRAV